MKLIDTDIASLFQRQRLDSRLQAWVTLNDPAEFAFAAPTIAEIRYGQARLPATHPRAAELDAWLRRLRAVARIVPLDAAAADCLGRMWATPALRNFVLSQPNQRQLATGGDLMIAAIALASDATLVTGNFADYTIIGAHFPALKVEDPLTGRTLP